MTSPLPLLLPWLRSEIRHEDASFAPRFLEGLPGLGSKHSIMRILQSLQNGLTRCEVFRGIWSRPFLPIKQNFAGFNRIIHSLADASRWAQGHCHRSIKTHDAYSNAGQRGAGEAVA